MALVSILMNGYNAEAYLREAIDSIYNQSFSDWEIIFIDNCSTDNTKAIIDSYDEKIKYYKTEKNISLGAARNFGLQFCKGQYLAFLDTDDIWLKDKLLHQVTLMQKHQEYSFCYGGVIYIDKEGKKIGEDRPKASSGDVFSKLLQRYEINMQSVLLRNSDNIAFNETLRHSPDYDLFMPLASRSKVMVIKEFVVKYRKLENSLTAKNIDVWWSEMQYTLDKIFTNTALEKRYQREYIQAYAKVAYYKARYHMSRGDKIAAREALGSHKFVDFRYFGLYYLLFFPKFFWDLLH